MHQHFNRIVFESREEVGEFLVVEDIATIALHAGVVQQQQAHAAEKLLLVADEYVRAVLRKSLGDRPRQARFVGHAQYDYILAFQTHSTVVRCHHLFGCPRLTKIAQLAGLKPRAG